MTDTQIGHAMQGFKIHEMGAEYKVLINELVFPRATVERLYELGWNFYYDGIGGLDEGLTFDDSSKTTLVKIDFDDFIDRTDGVYNVMQFLSNTHVQHALTSSGASGRVLWIDNDDNVSGYQFFVDGVIKRLELRDVEL